MALNHAQEVAPKQRSPAGALLTELDNFDTNFPELYEERNERFTAVTEGERQYALQFGLYTDAAEYRQNSIILYCHDAHGYGYALKVLPDYEDFCRSQVGDQCDMKSLSESQRTLLERRYRSAHRRRVRENEFLKAEMQNPYLIHEIPLPEGTEKSDILFEYIHPGINAGELFFSRKARDTLKMNHYQDIAAAVGLQLAHGLGTVHDHGSAFVDVRLNNVLVHAPDTQRGFVTLIGANYATSLIHDEKKPTAISPELCAPELAQQILDGNSPEPTVASDIYALGCLMFELATRGVSPFQVDPTRQNQSQMLLLAHIQQPVPRRILENLPNMQGHPINELICRCLAKNPADRPQSMKEVQAELAGILKDNSLLTMCGIAGSVQPKFHLNTPKIPDHAQGTSTAAMAVVNAGRRGRTGTKNG